MSPVFTAHLSSAEIRKTVCGEPWQQWQAPTDGHGTVLEPELIGGQPLLPGKEPKRGDKVRQCQACLHAAIEGKYPPPPAIRRAA